jgi:hypothetical protein
MTILQIVLPPESLASVTGPKERRWFGSHVTHDLAMRAYPRGFADRRPG